MRYLFVVAHPDDEVLGAGAFIFDAVRNGDAVGVMVMNVCDKTRYSFFILFYKQILLKLDSR